MDSFETRLGRESSRGKTEFFTDLAFIQTDEHGHRTEAVAKPEPLRRVKVLPPFSVSYEGNRYLPAQVAEVPESLADWWITNQWVVSDEPPQVVHDEPAAPPRRRGSRK
ncbi:hypothetical protein [Mycobacterium sp. 1165178.9]|uniref:hypothetical protein n=1 Tax=Mycobacterium sp. 1165178.9 TaxID=1834070 RepID=UPI000801953C|nr:hypothetical protein [Mycobacterium sp. 1165178.9]OBK98029.1 hypothetical protein A5652_06950 [Mycobacterium sp. 1165178.9]